METREQIVGKLMDEQARLQYDEGDPQRIFDTSEELTKAFVNLLNAVGRFRDEIQKEVTEDSADDMKAIRQEVVEAYAYALVNLHALGSMFRISGEAFDRMVAWMDGPEDAQMNMAGL